MKKVYPVLFYSRNSFFLFSLADNFLLMVRVLVAHTKIYKLVLGIGYKSSKFSNSNKRGNGISNFSTAVIRK